MSTSAHKLKAGKHVTIINVIANTVLTISKTTIGWLSGSSALLADGVHSLADLITDIFSYTMLKISHADPDDDHPYGHGKFETFGTFILALSLAFVAAGIAWQAIEKALNPQALNSLGVYALAASIFSILVNEFLFRYGKYMGEKVNSPILIANAWHHRSDSLSSLAAVTGITLALIGFPIADTIAALAVTLLLFKTAYNIGRRAFDELVDAAVDDQTQKNMLTTIKNVHGVIGCHFMRARLLGGRIFIDVHVDVPSRISVSEGHALAESVEYTLKNSMKEVEDVVVHIDPQNIDSTPLPKELERPAIEDKIIQIAQNHTGNKVSLQSLTFHLLKSGWEAQIILKTAPMPTKKEAENLKQKLIQKTKFTEISTSYTI